MEVRILENWNPTDKSKMVSMKWKVNKKIKCENF